MSQFVFTKAAAPANPAPGKVAMYVNTSGVPIARDENGNEVPMSSNASAFTQVNVAGNTDVTLTAAQLAYGIFEFVGALTGNINIIFPAVARHMLVDNMTSGAFTLTFKTSTQTGGIGVTQGTSASLYCNGTNVEDAESAKASKAGSASQAFSVGQATSPDHAVRLDQLTAYPSADNPVINGEFLVDQANNGAAVTINASQVPIADMWRASASGAGAGVYTAQQMSTTPFAGHKNYLRMTVTTAVASPPSADVYRFFQRIEGVNFARFSFGTAAAKTITLIFKARASIAGTYSGAFSNMAGLIHPFTFTLASANVEQTFAITIPPETTGTWPIDNGVGAGIFFDLGSGASNEGVGSTWQTYGAYTLTRVAGTQRLIATLGATLDITGVDIVEGALARPYPHKTFDEVLAQCERYYEKSAALTGVNGARLGIAFASWGCSGFGFRVQKRATPTVSIYSRNGTVSCVSNTSTGVDAAGTSYASNIGADGAASIGNNASGFAVGMGYEALYIADARL